MSCRSAPFGLVLLVLAACNFRIDPSWMPPGPRSGIDAGMAGKDADLEAGQDLVDWCRAECAADEDDECSMVRCADAAVCVDAPHCDRCLACRDE